LPQFKKYYLSGNLKFYNSGILKNLKLRILVRNILPISFKLNFTLNTLDSKGLSLGPLAYFWGSSLPPASKTHQACMNRKI